MNNHSKFIFRVSLTFAFFFLFALDSTYASERLSPDLLLKMADDVRNPSEVYKMKIGVKTSSTDQIFEEIGRAHV